MPSPSSPLVHSSRSAPARVTCTGVPGLVVPQRPKSSYIRFQAELPNECWQSDFTYYRLTNPNGRPGADTEILSWLDDCSRLALGITAHARVTGALVLTEFTKTVAEHGIRPPR
jgi:transposase InsO family protein